MNSNQKLMQDLHNAVSDKRTNENARADYSKTFASLGVPVGEASLLAYRVLNSIRLASTIEEAEAKALKLFNSQIFDGKNVFEMIQFGLQNRATIIYDQLIPYLKDVGLVIDYGCGSGILAQMLSDRIGIAVEGVDVRDFRAETVSVPILLFDGYKVPVLEEHYDCAILTNVIHHEANNEKILEELHRIVSRKLVIIETVPEADTEEAAKEDWGRMLLNDALWNRFFNYANIPVPGTYEIPSSWIKRFGKYGWKCVHSEDLGFDQPTIQDRHHLLVFER